MSTTSFVVAERGGAIPHTSPAARAAVDCLDEGLGAVERLVAIPNTIGKIPAHLPDQLVIGGELRRRRLTLTTASSMLEDYELAVMEKLQLDFALLGETMRKQGEETTATLNAVNVSLAALAVNQTLVSENLKGISAWMPSVEGSLHYLQLLLVEVGGRVAILESAFSADDGKITPRPEGHHVDTTTQGTVTNAYKAMAPALVK
ncbi:Hypothetical predicted protein, partial [Olea europaea subsp. europaea]